MFDEITNICRIKNTYSSVIVIPKVGKFNICPVFYLAINKSASSFFITKISLLKQEGTEWKEELKKKVITTVLVILRRNNEIESRMMRLLLTIVHQLHNFFSFIVDPGVWNPNRWYVFVSYALILSFVDRILTHGVSFILSSFTYGLIGKIN